MQPDLTIDWLWLTMQVVMLAGIIGQEMCRPHQRNLYALLIPGALLVLVQGQAWWLFGEFERNNTDELLHLDQLIGLDGARLANFYIGLSVICFGITYGIFARRRFQSRTLRSTHTRGPLSSHTSPLRQTLSALWTVGSGLLLIASAGGLRAAVSRPGQAIVGGLTMFLVLTSMGKLPLLQKIAARQKCGVPDVLLFVITFLLFLINSRLLASFILLQLALLINYCWREVSRLSVLFLVGTMMLIFFVFGLYREYTARYEEIDFVGLRLFFTTRTDTENPIAWFYGTNVEAFAGLAGLLTYEVDQGPIHHDFGVSNLRVLTQFIPYSLRNDSQLPFAKLANALRDAYPYNGSVVAAGLENAYAHFGLLGVLGLGVLLGFLTQWLHLQMMDNRPDRLQVTLLSVHSLQLVRGSFFNALFFGISEAVIVWLYRVLTATSTRQVEAPGSTTADRMTAIRDAR